MNYAEPRYGISNLGMYGAYQASPLLKGRYVSSLEEARAAQIDFDGSISIFPDLANNIIYTKQINLDGTLSLNKYTLAIDPTPVEPSYITKEEFLGEIEKIKEMIEKEKINEQPKSTKHNTELPAF